MPDRALFLYGPFRRGGQHTSMGNAQLDRDLKTRDQAWGVRDLESVAELGAAHRLDLNEVVRMPNNNLSLVFIRRRCSENGAPSGWKYRLDIPGRSTEMLLDRKSTRLNSSP